MKFTPQVKKILVDRISQKCLDLHHSEYASWQERWMIWLDEMWIEVVDVGSTAIPQHRRFHLSLYPMLDGRDKPARRPKNDSNWIYMDEPFLKNHFLKIPRDVAEKIIILGAP